MEEKFCRTERLIGSAAFEKLQQAKVIVFGIGGVGGYCVEALVRSGIHNITLVDGDRVSESNVNRQLIATMKTVGQPKVEVMRQRIADINPGAEVVARCEMYTPQNYESFPLQEYDYVVDAIDTVTSKLMLVQQAYKQGVSIISSMGTGNKLDPTRFEVCDIFKTTVCPLARVMRRELKARGIPGLKVVYSKEPAIAPIVQDESEKRTPASIAFVPGVAGLIIAGEVIKDIAGLL